MRFVVEEKLDLVTGVDWRFHGSNKTHVAEKEMIEDGGLVKGWEGDMRKIVIGFEGGVD